MTKQNYKRLGNYIRVIDVRNRELQCSNLLGLSIAKKFIPSIANTIGTDLRTYKIVHNKQFAYVPVTSRNGDKITIALYEGIDDCIVSQAYTVFEIVDPGQLLPDYLMMWFLRPEFDRYARFKSIGSAREVFDWGEMCEVYLPIPDIKVQRNIVSEYRAIANRIKINESLIFKIEEAAQSIYRRTFIDDIDKENLPSGWRLGTIGDIASISAGGDKPDVFSNSKKEGYSIPIYSNGIEKDGLYGYTNQARVTEESVTVSARGTIGFVCYRNNPYVPIVRLLVFLPKSKIGMTSLYLYCLLKNTRFEGDGAVQLQLTAPKAKEVGVIIPPSNIIHEFTDRIRPLIKYKQSLKKENDCLKSLSLTLLSLS